MDEIAILDFGGQYAHLICNRIRRLGVHAVIMAPITPASELKSMKGLILSGGPQSVNAKDALTADPKIFELGVPVLGICYGHQLTNKMLGGRVKPGITKEYGKTKLFIDRAEGVFKGINQKELSVWMSHRDEVTEMPVDFEVLAHTSINEFAAVGNLKKNIYGIQFHAEVTHTEQGMKILKNFVNLSSAKKTWNAKNYLEQIEREIRSVIASAEGAKQSRKVFMLVSGGVDSMVAFTLLNKVLGAKNVYGLLVDTGFMRKSEIEKVSEALDKLGFHNLHIVGASRTFYKALEGVTDPEKKRKIIGRTFVEVQAKAIHELGLEPKHWILGQGTIYPDTIESGGTKHADKIKTHHNRVPEIQEMIEKGLIIEPLKDLYKDEVRKLGEMLGLPHHLVWRHPFPGPGLAIRILCTENVMANDEVAKQSRDEENKINRFLKPHGFAGQILPIRSVGVQGDTRTYRHPLAITPLNGKTWRDFWDYKKLEKLSTELTNRFGSINRVIFQLYGEATSHDQLQTTNCLSPSRISFLQEADSIVMNEINTFDLEERSIWQCPTVLFPLKANEANATNEAILLRPVSSIDAMTASFVLIPKKNLKNILKKLAALNPSAIFYDLTNKPPATIEWE